MEGSPLVTKDKDDSSEKKGSGSKKKKTAEAIGAVIIEPKADQDKPKKSENWWEALGKAEAKPDRKDDDALLEWDTAESQEVSEAEAPLDHLSPNEASYIRSQIAEARLAEIKEQPVSADPVEALAGQRAETFLRCVAAGEDPEQIAADAIEPLNVEPETSEALPVTEPADHTEGLPGAAPEPEFMRAINEAEPPADTSLTPEDDDGITAAPPGAAGAGGRAGGTPPPAGPPPGGPHPPIGPPLPPRPTFGPGQPAYNPNLAPPTPATQRTEYVDRSNEVGMFFLGGIIGYLIGRRRGRIKTEKRLRPIQKKLEKQVEGLYSQLKRKEHTIRQTAIAEARAKHWGRAEKPAPLARELQTEQAGQRSLAPEATELHGKQRGPEHIGHVVVDAEAKQRAVRETASKVSLEARAETMSRAELLEASEKIVVDGSSLRQVYETHLVSERGLRRLMGEYLRGGDVKKALRREVVEREIDFERDPAMRDHAPQDSTSGGTGSLKDLLQKATIDADDNKKEELAIFKARAAYEAEQQQRQQRRRRTVDIGVVAIIAVLISLVITLYITRR